LPRIVRHGAECFNYSFPQELDDEFLVISDTLPGKVAWKYVNGEELRSFLGDRIDEGFCFPLNPKWVLADNGWKEVYDKMMASKDEEIQKSLETWYPQESGIRERIEAIHQRHPDGFYTTGSQVFKQMEGMEAMNLAENELRRYLVIRRATTKLRAALMFGKLGGVILRTDAEELNARYKKELNRSIRKNKIRRVKVKFDLGTKFAKSSTDDRNTITAKKSVSLEQSSPERNSYLLSLCTCCFKEKKRSEQES